MVHIEVRIMKHKADILAFEKLLNFRFFLAATNCEI
jgi:hypothetical protein